MKNLFYAQYQSVTTSIQHLVVAVEISTSNWLHSSTIYEPSVVIYIGWLWANQGFRLKKQDGKEL